MSQDEQAKVKSKQVLFIVTHDHWYLKYIEAPEVDERGMFNEKQPLVLATAFRTAKSQGWSV